MAQLQRCADTIPSRCREAMDRILQHHSVCPGRTGSVAQSALGGTTDRKKTAKTPSAVARVADLLTLVHGTRTGLN